MSTKLIKTEDYLLLIDLEAEIKEGDIVYRDTGVVFKITNERISYYKEVIPNTVHKIYRCIAYYPLTKEAEELDLPLLPNPFEEVDIEKLAINSFGHKPTKDDNDIILSLGKGYIKGFQAGYKAAQPKQFSLEDVKKAIEMAREYEFIRFGGGDTENKYTEEEIIQSLSTKQLPVSFEPEYEEIEVDRYVPKMPIDKLKTIINSEGKEELVGTYKY